MWTLIVPVLDEFLMGLEHPGFLVVVTLAITVIVATVAPQLLQDPTAALYTVGWLGGAIALWWSFAVFWREIKLIRGERSAGHPSQISVESAEALAGEVLLPLLRHFVTRWEQFEASENRWMGGHVKDMQGFAKNLSETLLGFDSKYADTWDSRLRNQVKNISNELRQFGVTPIQIISAYDTREENGKKAYELAKALVEQLSISKKKTDVSPPKTMQSPNLDPVAIAHKCVQERWGRDVRIVKWPTRPKIVEEGDKVIVSGMGIDDQQRSHTYRVPMTKDGKIIYDEVLAT